MVLKCRLELDVYLDMNIKERILLSNNVPLVTFCYILLGKMGKNKEKLSKE